MEHASVGGTLNNMAIVLQTQGKLGDAMTMYEEALRIVKKNLGSEHARVGETLYNMAILVSKRQEEEEAKRLVLQAHAIFISAGRDGKIRNFVEQISVQYGAEHEFTVFAQRAVEWVEESEQEQK